MNINKLSINQSIYLGRTVTHFRVDQGHSKLEHLSVFKYNRISSFCHQKVQVSMAVMTFAAPCSVVLFALFIRLSLLQSHETNLRCIYSHTNLTSSVGTTSHWVKLTVFWQKRLTKHSAILKSSCRSGAVFLNLLLLCGDVSLNPGPGVKHPLECALSLSDLTKRLFNVIIAIVGTTHDVVILTMLFTTP